MAINQPQLDLVLGFSSTDAVCGRKMSSQVLLPGGKPAITKLAFFGNLPP
ncbi:hypothetical protein H6G06_24720 [Anabaena sphaerica FACHB-251]|uniref:Uncharacterized protein n=1 Tax=Anabaena sphaerica FACHB-251 TaxID=2692883 RepID=A0A926WL07_9NOST|nr:hypothetical protein [Anabaena sphaerica]MBD2296596.1 hypothetical protein [Anabaena sphaerica FACHB-251]